MRILVTGAGGQLGHDLVDVLNGCRPPGAVSAPGSAHDEVFGLEHSRLDVSDRHRVAAAFDALAPDVVVHCAAWTAVDACEGDPDRAYAVNAMGTRNVAEAARRHGAHVVYLSTDYVFDGTAPHPYTEWELPNPVSVYGKSKLGGESELDPEWTVVRTSWVCGFHGSNMARTVMRLAGSPGPMRFVDDQRGSPSFTADLAGALTLVARERLPGTFHLTNQGVTSWFGFAQAVLRAVGGDPGRVEPIATADLDPPRPAPRPANSVLDNVAWRALGMTALPAWEDGLARLVAALGSGIEAPSQS